MDALEELKIRKEFCKYCIRTIEALPDTESRKVSALETYRGQLVKIQERIDALEKPPDIVVGLKSATISGTVPK